MNIQKKLIELGFKELPHYEFAFVNVMKYNFIIGKNKDNKYSIFVNNKNFILKLLILDEYEIKGFIKLMDRYRNENIYNILSMYLRYRYTMENWL